MSSSSPLFTYCRSLCLAGGSWRADASPMAGFRLARVQAIVRSVECYSAYTHQRARLTNLRLTGGGYFNSMTNDMTAEQLHVLHVLRSNLHDRAPGTGNRSVNSFYCYHGPRIEHCESICKNGMVATAAKDAGYFGCGCYTTLNIEYAARHARGDFDSVDKSRPAPEDSLYPVIMFAVSCAMAYPVTSTVDYGHNTDHTCPAGHSNYFGRPLERGFDCHVSCVNRTSKFQAVSRADCQYVANTSYCGTMVLTDIVQVGKSAFS
jgi:hypothetical protein